MKYEVFTNTIHDIVSGSKKLIFILLLFPLLGNTQNLDSLYKTCQTKKCKREVFKEIIIKPNQMSDRVIIQRLELMNIISKELDNDTLRLEYNMRKAVWLSHSGLYDSSTSVYQRNIELLKSMDLKIQLMENLRGIGINYGRITKYETALDYFIQSLNIAQEINDNKGIASAYNNIGIIEYNMKNYEKAVEFYLKSIAIKEELNDSMALMYDYQNISGVFFDLKQFEKSMVFSKKAYAYTKQFNDEFGEALALVSIGLNLQHLDSLDKAMEYYIEADSINNILNNPWLSITVKNALASIHLQYGNYKKSLEYYEITESLADQNKMLNELKEAYGGKASCYEALEKPYLALAYFKKYEEIKDTIFKQNKIEQIQELEAKYQSQQKENEINLLNKSRELDKAKIKEQELIEIVLVIGSFFLLSFLIFVFKQLRTTKKQKIIIEETNEELNQTNEELAAQRDEIEQQKNIIEHTHNEVKASINYAERIQKALLDNKEHWEAISQEHFILFKPRDVVSGDFYWAYNPSVSPQRGENTAEGKVLSFGEDVGEVSIWAAADCTGHGVPGAFMSMLGVSFLNEIVAEGGETNAGRILDKLRAKIIKTLEQKGSSSEQKDGMDIAICVWNKTTNILQYAGANNPLLIIRKNTVPQRTKDEEYGVLVNDEFVLLEAKPDKMPIGKYVYEEKPFSTHEIQLQKNDTIYTFTDGFQDQFGGADGKKYMTKRMKEFLIHNAHLPMPLQHQKLEDEFENWMKIGNSEQIDDVCLIGVKI